MNPIEPFIGTIQEFRSFLLSAYNRKLIGFCL